MELAEIERLIGGPPRLNVEGILAHPRLPQARKVYIDRFLELYGGDPFLVRLLIESGRFLVYYIIAILERGQDLNRRETWATVGLLKQTMAMFGLASGRHIDALVGRLCAVGYLELQPSEQDRRVRILKPTEKLRAHDREWRVVHFAPLAVLYPRHDYAPLMRRDQQFHDHFLRVAVHFLPFSAKLLASMPDMVLIFNRAAGFPVIAALLQAAMAHEDYPHAAVPYADVGDRFGVSRTHVRKLLLVAEEAGLVKLHARGGRCVEILPRLWSSQLHSMALAMHGHDLVYLAALRQWRSRESAAQASGY